MKSLSAVLAIVIGLACVPGPPALAAEESRLLRVLFLGDNGHHRPDALFKVLQPQLAGRQIRMDYTESLDELTPSKLAGYDCLLIYANHTKISKAQEKALLDYVAGGGGLAAIHCASYCFLNSSAYVEMVGGQFKSHGTGVIKESIVNPSHPIMTGLSPIESWDETYVHTHHNTNRLVLAERRDEKGAEPYTWVRGQGQGRVFYTAWGHDERTWTNNTFQHLLENGVRWTSENSPGRLHVHSGLKPFEYTGAPDALPNYVPSAKWGTQGDPIKTMQKPLSPEDSIKHLVVPAGFSVKLFAAEPEIAKPIWMAWDERGRLWVAETVDYPNNMQPPGQGHDRIKICDDTKGEGHADKFTIFAGRLSVPTSFVFANGGVIVVHSGKTEFFKDTDGDDKADVRTVLFTGWGTNDTHAGPSNLRFGFDGWIWGTVGYSGFEGTVGGKKIRFGQGIFRFKPDGSALEFVRSSNNNTWGLGISEDNLIFGSTANGNASMYLPIANRYYEAVNGWSASRLETIADSQNFFPITDKVRQVDWHGKYTAGAGSAIYTARAFPKEFWNRVQFVAEPTGHLLGKFYLESRGADFVAHNQRNFAASDDEWTAPICAEVGPDGALWLIDWYNYIVQHNPTPHGFKSGKGNAYETTLRDKTHGRIYRIVYDKAGQTPPMQLKEANPQELVETLKNDNLFWRMTAQRLLLQRGKRDVIPSLCALAHSQEIDELGLNVAAIHALWTLKDLGVIEDDSPEVTSALRAALQHPSAAVRQAAVTVAPRAITWLKEIHRHRLLADSNAQVRLATMLAISEMPPHHAIATQLVTSLQSTNVFWDRWLGDAATCAAARNDFEFLEAALKTPGDSGALREVVQRASTHYANRAPKDSVLNLLAAMKGQSASIAGLILESLAANWPESERVSVDEATAERLRQLMESLNSASQTHLLLLAQKWHQAGIFPKAVSKLSQSLKATLANASAGATERITSAKELLSLDDSPETIQLILAQVNTLSPPDLAAGLISAMSQSRAPQIGGVLVQHLPQLTPAARRLQISTLLRRPEWSSALLDAIEKGSIPSGDLATEQWSELKNNSNSQIARRAAVLSDARGVVTADRVEIVNKLLPIANVPGNPVRGKEVFTANCAVCHTFAGQGGKVGPDLTGIGARDHKEILIDILDPNRSVEANYRMWNVTTADDETFSGRLETETQTTVELLDAAGQKHVLQRKDIKEMNTGGLSIMPNGFEVLPADDLKALLTFLTEPVK